MTTEAIVTLIVSNLFEIVLGLVSAAFTGLFIPWFAKNGIPWLKEKRLYSLVRKFVYAVEKEAESGAIAKIDKNSTVVSLLEAKGIKVTPEVKAFIESAVKELDIAAQKGMVELTGTFVEETSTDEQA